MRCLGVARRIPALAARAAPAGVAVEEGRGGRRSPRPARGPGKLLLRAAVAALAAAASSSPDAGAGQPGHAVGAQASSPAAAESGNEIDRFMERVLENRDASWRRIDDFVLREVLTLDVDGPAGLPITGFLHEYEWYVRGDVVVRSPRRFDGVDIGEAERREYEAEWLRRRERREAERREEEGGVSVRVSPSEGVTVERRRAAEGAGAAAAEGAADDASAAAEAASPAVADGASAAAEAASPAVADGASAAAEAASPAVAGDAPAAAEAASPAPGRREAEAADPERLEPEFITDAGYFLEFPFEPGNYYLVGYETLEGREVVKIEYYPTDLFDDDSEPESERERRIAEGFAKTSLVTLWVDPEFHEVVRYTFENVGLDFLPGRWLVRVDGWHASIEMAQPIGGVWLPSRMILTGSATTALGAFEMRLTREYSDYREALTSGRVVGTGDLTGDPR